MREAKSKDVTLIGAGLVGSLLASFLGRRGFRVRVYERRPDMRLEKISAGRSINLAVSVRGLHSLKQIGLEEKVLSQAIAMKGRMIHAPDGALAFQRYGKDDSECIHSISRGTLNRLLMSQAESSGDVKIEFGRKLVAVDLQASQITLKGEKGGPSEILSASCLIGTDGSASVVRDALIHATGGKCSEETLAHGYKELSIPAGPGGSFQLEKHALHIWPRGTYMLIALPNLDGSFTCTLFLPMKGPVSFETLKTGGEVSALFRAQFNDALKLIPELETIFFENPTGHMVTVKAEPWSLGDRALVLGDAAHAIVPFFGQGMNCGFEDCTILERLMVSDSDAPLARVFADFTAARKSNADAIADMAVENFVEMRDKVGQPRFLMEKGVERILHEHFKEYVSRYSLVSFSREPYRFAYDMGLIQAEILGELCDGISAPEQVDLTRAKQLIEKKLVPFLKDKKGEGHGSQAQR